VEEGQIDFKVLINPLQLILTVF